MMRVFSQCLYYIQRGCIEILAEIGCEMRTYWQLAGRERLPWRETIQADFGNTRLPEISLAGCRRRKKIASGSPGSHTCRVCCGNSLLLILYIQT